MPKIALFGAVGAIGQSIASALRSQGQPYRVVGRSQHSLLCHTGEGSSLASRSRLHARSIAAVTRGRSLSN